MRLDVREVSDFISKQSLDSHVYLGCDSVLRRTSRFQYVTFVLVAVVHIDGRRGCKIFGEKIVERSNFGSPKNPKLRLMAEASKVCELYDSLRSAGVEHDIEVHLDMSRDPRNKSSEIVDAAVGYVKGVCDVVPRIKPDSWAATCVADRLLRDRAIYNVA